MNTDRVAGRSADRLQSDDPVGRDSNSVADLELEEREHHVAHRIAARDEGTEAAHERREKRPRTANRSRNSFSQSDRHLVEIRGTTLRIDEDLNHRDGKDERHRGFQRGLSRLRPGEAVGIFAHAVKQERRQGHDDEDCAWQVKRLSIRVDARSENVFNQDGDWLPCQERFHAKFRDPRDDKQHGDQQVRSPGFGETHRRAAGVRFNFDGASPLGVPLVPWREVPWLALRHQKPAFGERDDDRQSGQASQQRREVRTEKPRHKNVRNRHREGGEQSKLPDAKSVGKRSVRAEETSHRHHHEQGNQRSRDRVQHGHFKADHHEQSRLINSSVRRDRSDEICEFDDTCIFDVQPGSDAFQNRRPERSKGDRCTLNRHPGHNGGHWRKAQATQQRHTDCGRRSEPGSSFDERTEQPGDDDDLNSSIGRDVKEASPDDRESSAFLQRVEQQDGSENDEQQRRRDDESVQARRRNLPAADLPHKKCQARGRQIRKRHRPTGRPAQRDQENSDHNNRQKGEQCEHGGRHRRSVCDRIRDAKGNRILT